MYKYIVTLLPNPKMPQLDQNLILIKKNLTDGLKTNLYKKTKCSVVHLIENFLGIKRYIGLMNV